MRLAMKLQIHSHPYAATYAMRSQARWQNARMKLRQGELGTTLADCDDYYPLNQRGAGPTL